MTQYVIRAEKLKPLVEKANFTPEQLTLVHRMMRGCTMLRQGKVITSFFQMMLPDDLEIKEGAPQATKYGKTFRPIYVVPKGGEFTEPQTADTEEEESD